MYTLKVASLFVHSRFMYENTELIRIKFSVGVVNIKRVDTKYILVHVVPIYNLI
jgi:hypothetical protein